MYHARLIGWIILSVQLFNSSLLFAQGKKEFHLFHRTPDSLLRPMTTDRPDITETAYTVDAGRFQFELDFINLFQHPNEEGLKETDFLFLNGFAKVGLTHRTELQLQFSAWQLHFPQLKKQGSDKLYQGIGDLGFRYKYNIKGNDSDGIALAIMPSLMIPLRNKASEGYFVSGVNLIMGREFSNDLELGGQVEYHLLFRESGKFESDEFWFTFLVGGPLAKSFDWFAESAMIFSNSNPPRPLANGGVIYEVTPNLLLDFAFQFGLNRHAHRSLFVGFSWRI